MATAEGNDLRRGWAVEQGRLSIFLPDVQCPVLTRRMAQPGIAVRPTCQFDAPAFAEAGEAFGWDRARLWLGLTLCEVVAGIEVGARGWD